MTQAMPDPDYIPNLSVKRAEVGAVATLAGDVRIGTQPCFHAPIRSRRPGRSILPTDCDLWVNQIKARLELTKMQDLLFGNAQKFFLDVGRVGPGVLTSYGLHPIVAVFDELEIAGFRGVPVTELTRNFEYQDAIKHVISSSQRGCAIRVFVPHVKKGTFELDFRQTLEYLGLDATKVDIILDLGYVQSRTVEVLDSCKKLTDLMPWRNLAICGGSFPKSLSSIKDGEAIRRRIEWEIWSLVRDREKNIGRKIIFSDHTTRHPVHSVDVVSYASTPNIRYTTSDGVLITRGKASKNDVRRSQYQKLAKKLTESKKFMGDNFSAGDKFFSVVALGCVVPGNSEPYIMGNQNHHMTFIARELRGEGSSDRIAA